LLPEAARADCFLNGATVTCMPPGTNGYFDPTGDNLTLTVQPGTTVVDNGFSAILLRDSNRITNDGTIAAGDNAAAIYVGDRSNIINNGTITAGADGAGVSGGDGTSVTNSGRITVGDGFGGYGIALGLNGTVFNSGTITVGQGANAIAVGDNAILPWTDTVTNTGTINVGDAGAGIIVTDNHRVLNSGTITGGIFALGIVGDAGNVVTNTGNIVVGPAGTGVEFMDRGNTLYNYGTIKTTGGAFSIEACGCAAVNNAFNNMKGGTLDGYISVDGANNTVTNSGLITITDPVTPLIGFPTYLIANLGGTGAGNSFVQTATGTLALRMDNTGLIDNLSADAITPGGTVKIVIQPQLYQAQTFSGTAIDLTPYGVLTLGNTINAPFANYTSSSLFFAVTPIYDTNDPTNYQALSFQLDRIPFGAVPGETDNQRAVGNALEQGYSPALDPNSSAGQFYTNLFAATSLGVLDQLSGAGTAATQSAAFGAGGLFNDAMLQQGLAWLTGTPGGGTSATLSYASAGTAKAKPGADAFAAMTPKRAAPAPQWRAWGLGFGSTRSVGGSGGTPDQSIDSVGGALGVERTFGSDLLVGFAAGGSGSSFSVSGLSTSGRVDGGHVGVYAGKRWGDVYALATLNYARLDNTTDRTITGIGPTETAHGRFASDQLGGRLEIGWRQQIAGYAVTPFVAVEPAALWQQTYSESATTAGGGPGTLGLNYAARETTSLPTFVGAQLDGRYTLGEGVVRPFLRAAWVHEFMPERQIAATFVSVPTPAFTVDGARPARDAARIGAGATWSFGAHEIFARIDSEVSGGSTMLAGTAGARVTW